VGDVVAVGEVDDKDCTEHYDDDADGANAEQRARQYGDASSELGQSHEIADSDGHFHKSCKALRARATEHSKKDRAAVENKGQRAGDAHDQELEIQFACGPEVRRLFELMGACLSWFADYVSKGADAGQVVFGSVADGDGRQARAIVIGAQGRGDGINRHRLMQRQGW
jgi:hypothetical protein